MENRPKLSSSLDAETFLSYYYLKEELTSFCKEVNLSVRGGKIELTTRIADFLTTKKIPETLPCQPQKKAVINNITVDAFIEPNLVCSEIHRTFFKQHISNFSFNVAFQKWLKENTGKTYQEAIDAYAEIKAQKKLNKTVIDKQFEYNTYIRDFFADNPKKSLKQAIECWKYKKRQIGHHRYEPSDLASLNHQS